MPLLEENASTRLGLTMPDLAKVGVGIVGITYAVGFLVVTFHLSAFGVAPVAWLRPQYLLAGIWCFLPALWVVCGIAIVPTGLLEPWIRGSLDVPPRTRRARHVLGGFQGLALVFCVFVVLSLSINSLVTPSEPKIWGAGSIIALRLGFLSLFSAAAIVSGIYLLYGAIKFGPMRKDQRIMTISVGILMLVIALQIAVTYVRIFSDAVYSAIPSTYGGGRPQSVVFLIDRVDQRPSPVIPDSSGTRSIPYNLLLVTDSNYVVQSHSKTELAIEFKQDSVRGMIVLR
jgi:hypothetical protein